MELMVNLHDDTLRVYDRQNTARFESFRGSLICGAHSEFFVIDTASQASISGVLLLSPVRLGTSLPLGKLPNLVLCPNATRFGTGRDG